MKKIFSYLLIFSLLLLPSTGFCLGGGGSANSSGSVNATVSNNPTGSGQVLVSTANNSATWQKATSAFVFGFPATIQTSEEVYMPSPYPVTFPTTFGSTNTFVKCKTNPSESDQYTVVINSTSIAQITVSSSCTLSFNTIVPSAVASAGDLVGMIAPATTVSGNVTFTVVVTKN